MSSKQITYKIYIPPSEWGMVEPLKEISDYIRNKINRVEKVSDHHIARMFPILEDFVQGRELKSTAIAKIMDIYGKHFGFSNEEEIRRVNNALARLIEKLAELRVKEPVAVFKLVRSLRTLLIGFVRGRIKLPIQPYQKKS